MSALISLSQVSKHYDSVGERFTALRDVSLQVHQNEFVAITGPSGSGKSTLMNIVGCLDTCSEGSYLLNGVSVKHQSEEALAAIRNREIGFIFQSFNLIPRVSIVDNVLRPLAFMGVRRSLRRKMAMEALALVDMADKANNLPNQVSGGQLQRAAIARAVVTRPSILLADEPTGNLDSQTTAEVLGLFDRLHAEGQTILLVTHEEDVAERSFRRIRLLDGTIAEDIDTERKRELLYESSGQLTG